MRVSKRKKLLFILAIAIVVIAAGIWLCASLIRTHLQSRRIDRLLSDFAANPSNATASPLVDLLEEYQVDADDGTRIVKVLLEPDVKVAQPCIAGEEVRITVGLKHLTPAITGLFKHLDGYTFSVKGKGLDYSFVWVDFTFTGVPGGPPFPRSVLGPDSPARGDNRLVITEPGVYTGLLRLECGAQPIYDYESLGGAFHGGGLPLDS